MKYSRKLLVAATLAVCSCLASTSVLSAVGSKEETTQLIEVLQSDKGVFDKAKACQRLAVVGTEEAIPVLAGLLSKPELAHYARFALEPMQSAAVDEALRKALGQLDGQLRIGVINSIGARRDAGALKALIDLSGSKDAELALAAAAALGRIGSPEAAATLRGALEGRSKELGVRLGEAAIVCGERLGATGKLDLAVSTFAAVRKADLPAHIRASALRGEILVQGDAGADLLLETISGPAGTLRRIAFGVARELPGTNATLALAGALEKLPADAQAQILRALADRGDRSALPAVLKCLDRDLEATRIAAIRALEQLGDASTVPRLVFIASTDGAERAGTRAAALATLAAMGDDDVDGAALALLDIALRRSQGERGASFLLATVEVAGSRMNPAAVRLLKRAAEHSNESVRFAAVRALGTTVTLDDFAVLVERLSKSRNDAETNAVQDALKMASRRMPSPAACSRALASAMEGASTEAKVRVLGVLPGVGGSEALGAVVAGAGSSESSVRDAALAALGAWPHESAANQLLEIIPKLDGEAARQNAYRAFHDIVRRLGFDRNRRIGVCVKAMELARSDAERQLTIGALAGIPAPRTLKVLTPHLESETLGDAAASAMVTICERLIRTRQRGAVGPAMQKVLAATKNADLVRRAQSLVKQASGN